MSPMSYVLRPTPGKRPGKRSGNPFHAEQPPARQRMSSAEEKRQLILEHLSAREPVDSVQRFSLWAGITVCVLVIAAGWIYSMRQTIAGAFDSSPVDRVVNEFKTTETDGTHLQDNLNALMDHLNTIQTKSAAELQTMQAVAEQVQEAASSSAARRDLFKPASTSTSKTPSLPSGVKVENY